MAGYSPATDPFYVFSDYEKAQRGIDAQIRGMQAAAPYPSTPCDVEDATLARNIKDALSLSEKIEMLASRVEYKLFEQQNATAAVNQAQGLSKDTYVPTVEEHVRGLLSRLSSVEFILDRLASKIGGR